MFKFKKLEEMKGKIKQLKILAITIGVIFVLMFLNIIYLNIKVINLTENQNIMLEK